MQLRHLSLTNFRNYARLDIDIPGGTILIVGGNAQGKTSLLEAVYYLATFTSFHASQDRELINFMFDKGPFVVCRIVADFHYTGDSLSQPNNSGKNHHIEVRIIKEEDENGTSRLRKEILVNGVGKKVGEAIGAFNAVLFQPQMMRIVDGPPEERRRMINLAIGQVAPRYAVNLAEYQRVLSQRNALLKQINDRGGDPGQLQFWDDRLTLLGSAIIYARIQAIHELETIATRLHRELTRDQEVLRLEYLPGFEPMPEAERQYKLPLRTPLDRTGLSIEYIKQRFMDHLETVRTSEIQRGITTIGPHRDELRFLSNGIDLGTYGSRGQGRTAVLSLKLAEMNWMRQKTGQMPVLLLDEVLAELDPSRREDLLDRTNSCEQALITTTDLDLFSKDYLKATRVWEISSGQVQA